MGWMTFSTRTRLSGGTAVFADWRPSPSTVRTARERPACTVLLVTNLYPDSVDPAKGVFVRNTVRLLRALGVTVRTIALPNRRTLGARLASYLSFYLRTFWTALTSHYDVVYVHYVSHSTLPVLMARALGRRRPLVTHVHGSDVLAEHGASAVWARLKRVLSAAAMDGSSRIVVPSPYFRDVLSSRYGINPERIVESPSGGIDTEVFQPMDTTCTWQKDADIHLAFVSRLIPEKGVSEYLQVVEALVARGITVCATLVGDGPLRSSVEDEARRLGVRHIPAVEQPDLAAIMSHADLFVFPSTRAAESLGLVGLESMATGTPVVAYAGAGAATYVETGKNGFLVPPGEWHQIVDSILRYHAMERNERGAMMENARATAQRYDSSEVGSHLKSVLCDEKR